MTYTEYREQKGRLQAALKRASEAMEMFPRGPMGLTPDDVKASQEWKIAKGEQDRAFAQLRAFNGLHVKRFRQEDALALEAGRAAKLKGGL